MDAKDQLVEAPFFPKGCERVLARLTHQDPQFPPTLERWVSLAERGDPRAQINLAAIHYRAGNSLEAASLLRMAAEAGHSEAMARYATALLNGVGVIKDPTLALKWYGEAAKRRHVVGTYGFACCYLNGEGVLVDLAVGLHFMKKAAALGYPAAVTYMKNPRTRALDAKTPRWS